MIKIKPGRDWKKARALLKNYGERMDYVRDQIAQGIAKVFHEKLLSIAPKGPEYEEYRKSLQIVQLTGTQEEIGYAVVSNRKAVRLDVLREQEGNPTVVYIEPKKGRGRIDPLIALMVQNNPWPPDMIPHNLSEGEVLLVHTAVTQSEYDFAYEKTRRYMQENQVLFSRSGAILSRDQAAAEGKLSELSSLPDYLSFALRTEFGLNMAPIPHWRPALRDVVARLQKIIQGNDKVQKALYDQLFRDHLKSEQKMSNNMAVGEFEKEAGVFQKKVSAVVGGGL